MSWHSLYGSQVLVQIKWNDYLCIINYLINQRKETICPFLTINLFPLCQEARWGDMVISNKSDSERWPGADEGSRDGAATVSPGEAVMGYLQVIINTSPRRMRLNVEALKFKLYSLLTAACLQVPFLANKHWTIKATAKISLTLEASSK